MFGLDPEFETTIVTTIGALITYYSLKPKYPSMQKVVNWTKVAKLEHETGIDHDRHSVLYCPNPERHWPAPVLTGAGVETLTRSIANFGILTSNEMRNNRRLLAVPYKPGDPRHPDEYDKRVLEFDRDVDECRYFNQAGQEVTKHEFHSSYYQPIIEENQ